MRSLGRALLLSAVVAAGDRAVAQGVVSGRVVLDGVPPPEQIKLDPDAAACEPARAARTWEAGEDKGLAGVVVFVRGARGTVQPQEAKLTLQGCVFSPRTQALPAGSMLEITNDDPLFHLVHAQADKGQRTSVSMPFQGQKARWKLDRAGLLQLRCDVHPFQRGGIAVFDHPFYAVTGKDGRFRIPDVPPGEYELVAWHYAGGEQKRRVRVGADATTMDFAFNAAPAPPAAPRQEPPPLEPPPLGPPPLAPPPAGEEPPPLPEPEPETIPPDLPPPSMP